MMILSFITHISKCIYYKLPILSFGQVERWQKVIQLTRKALWTSDIFTMLSHYLPLISIVMGPKNLDQIYLTRIVSKLYKPIPLLPWSLRVMVVVGGGHDRTPASVNASCGKCVSWYHSICSPASLWGGSSGYAITLSLAWAHEGLEIFGTRPGGLCH